MRINFLLIIILTSFMSVYADVETNIVLQDSVKKDTTKIENDYPIFSSESWCEDQTTFYFSDSTKHRAYFSGIRLIIEPQVGIIFQSGDNRILQENFKDLPKFGIESNLYEGYISLQLALIYPSLIDFDDNSEVVRYKYLRNGGKNVHIDLGYTFGLSFFDGILSSGYGVVKFDERDFSSTYYGKYSKNFFYFNVQVASLTKYIIKQVKE